MKSLVIALSALLGTTTLIYSEVCMTVGDCHEDLAELEEELEAQDIEIDGLKKKNDQNQKMLQKLKQEIGKKQSLIKDLQEEVNILQTEIKDLEEQFANDDSPDDIEELLAEKEQEIEILTNQVTQLEKKLQDAVSNMQRSASRQHTVSESNKRLSPSERRRLKQASPADDLVMETNNSNDLGKITNTKKSHLPDEIHEDADDLVPSPPPLPSSKQSRLVERNSKQNKSTQKNKEAIEDQAPPPPPPPPAPHAQGSKDNSAQPAAPANLKSKETTDNLPQPQDGRNALLDSIRNFNKKNLSKNEESSQSDNSKAAKNNTPAKTAPAPSMNIFDALKNNPKFNNIGKATQGKDDEEEDNDEEFK